MKNKAGQTIKIRENVKYIKFDGKRNCERCNLLVKYSCDEKLLDFMARIGAESSEVFHGGK